jgi:hypothetical protein
VIDFGDDRHEEEAGIARLVRALGVSKRALFMSRKRAISPGKRQKCKSNRLVTGKRITLPCGARATSDSLRGVCNRKRAKLISAVDFVNHLRMMSQNLDKDGGGRWAVGGGGVVHAGEAEAAFCPLTWRATRIARTLCSQAEWSRS